MIKFITIRERFAGNQFVNIDYISRILPSQANLNLPVRVELTIMENGKNIILQTLDSYEDVKGAINAANR